MDRRLTLEERTLGACFCLSVAIGIYIYIKLTMPLYWPFTWIDSLVMLLLDILIYVGMPFLVLFGLHRLMLHLLRKEITKYGALIERELSSLEFKLSESKKELNLANRRTEGELKKVLEEIEKLSREIECRQAPVQEIQNKALQEFL